MCALDFGERSCTVPHLDLIQVASLKLAAMKGPRVEIAPDISTDLNKCLSIAIFVITIFHFTVSYFTNWGVNLDIVHEQKTTPDHDSGELLDVEKFLPLLTFVPAQTPVIFYPWVLVTSAFIEREIVVLAIVPLLILLFGSYIEKIWGIREYARYLVIIAVIPNIILYIYYEVKAIFSSAKAPLIFSGLSIGVGIITAASKLIPDHQVYIFQDHGFRMKLFPSIIIAICGVTHYFSTSDIHKVYFVKAYLGFVVSWTYLRFFQRNPSSAQIGLLPPFVPKKNRPQPHRGDFRNSFMVFNLNSNGDRSAKFALTTFFPFPISGLVGDVSNLVFLILVKYKVLLADSFEQVEDQPSLISSLRSLSIFKPSVVRVKLQQVWSWARSKKKGINGKTVSNGKRKLALKELE